MADWLKLSPTSGSGNGTVNVSGVTVNTGRDARTTQITFSAANCDNVVRNVSQAGVAEFVDIDSTATSDKGGGTVTISGTSNSTALTFSLGTTGDLEISLPANYTANSISTANGAEISGDPGATSQFDFSIQIEVPENTTTEELSRQIIVTDNAGNTSTCTLTLAAGEPYLEVDEGDITLSSGGAAVTINVRSNTSWTVE